MITRPVSEYVLYTLAAQLTTFPILIHHFQRLSWTSFFVNPLILPAQPPVMVLGGLALLAGMAWLSLGRVLAPLVYPFMFFTIRIVEKFAVLPGGVLDLGSGGIVMVLAWYGALVVLTWGADFIPGWGAKIQPAAFFTGLLIGLVLVWRSVFAAPDGRLHLKLLDVGSGSALLVIAPTGERVLINGGPSSSLLSDQLGRIFPPFNRGLDRLLVASPLENDVSGLVDVLDRYPPHRVLWMGAPSPSRSADRLRAGLKTRQIPVENLDPGAVLQLGSEVSLRVLTETKRGGTLLLTYGRFRGLLPFGLDEETIQNMEHGRSVGAVSLYLLADNGDSDSNPRFWLQQLNPRLCLLSVGADDEQGRPLPSLLDRLGGYSLVRTDLNGTINLTTDGKHLWVEVTKFPR